MELLPNDAKTLRDMVSKEWFPNKEHELEATFGADGVVDSTRFLAVAQRLKSKGWKETRQPDRLTISLEDNTRYTIQEEGTIAAYCGDNDITGKGAKAMIKDRAGNLHTLDIKEYDTRVKIRREIALDMNDPRVKSHLATWDQRVKFFRLIQRWTFTQNGCVFDLSMVRSTKKDERGLWKQVKNFYDADLHHNIMKEKPSYEIEVELDHKSEFCDTPEKATQALIQGIGEVLRGIQRNPILIRNSVKEKVLEGYNLLVGATGEQGKKGFRGVQPITLVRENMKNLIMGPKTPNIRSGYNVTDKADGLRVMGYCDDKGELFMMDMGMNIYRTGLKKLACANTLVDGEWITVNKKNEAVQMFMLFDIYHGLNNLRADKLPFYHKQEDVQTRYNALKAWGKAWRSEEGPISLVKGLNPQNSLKVMEKKFLFADGEENNLSTDIFAKCGQMLAREVVYNTDGLILTENQAIIPEKFGVRFNKQFKWKPPHDNTIDFLVKIVKDTQTNQDKLTDAISPDSQDTIKYKTLRLYVGTSADPAYDDPRRTILMIKPLPSGRAYGRGVKKYRMRPVLFSPKEFEDSMASVCYLEANQELASGEWVSRCTTKEDAPGEATGDPITDNSIVEMRYDPDPSLQSGWNWVPIRVRYDKTERFQGGAIDKTLNSVETAESVWTSIHEPITEHMISTGDLAPSKEEQEQIQIAKERSVALSQRYYQKKSTIKNVALVKNLANFHNLVIKGDILTRPILSNTTLGLPAKKKVIDTSIGKGGDIGRYMDYVDFLMGVDIDADGIRDPDEGAYRRYLKRLVDQQAARSGYVPTMVFYIGDSSKSYMDGKAGANEEEADMLRATIGKVPNAAKVPPYVEAKCKGQLANGADLITSMFSIHYYFKTKDTWDGFLGNIRDNLKVGGFFVCCCFDGDKVAKVLELEEKGGSVTGVDETTNATIWKITKQNDLSEGQTVPTTYEEAFGHAIDVEFLSIGAPHTEYLVSKNFLIAQMNSIGCELATESDCKLLGLPSGTQSFEETYASNPNYSTVYTMESVVKTFSFFNRWYVFRRYGKAPGQREVQETTVPIPAPKTPDYAAALGISYSALPQTTTWVPTPSSPMYSPASPVYGATTTTTYAPQSPMYSPASPVYGATTTTTYAPTTTAASPVYGTTLPTYSAASPDYGATTTTTYPPQSPMYSPASPVYGATTTANSPPFVPEGSTYVGTLPTGETYYYSAASPNYGAMATLATRPKSPGWSSIPLSGNTADNAALQIMVPKTPPIAPSEEEESPLGSPPYFVDPNEQAEATKKWNEKKARLEAKAKSGLVTAVVEGGSMATSDQRGGDRTVAVERGNASGPQKKYKASEIFRFFGRAEIKDSLGIDDPGAARWLALSAPFPIKDGGVEYPTINHYLAGMKYKLATDKPELGPDLFSSKGTIHAKYLRQREQIATKHKDEKGKPQVKEQEDQELLRAESADVADASLPKTIKRYKAQLDEAKWIAEKDNVLKEALKQRWKYDARFRRIVEAARTKGKYLLYYTGSTTISSFGGIRREDGRIEGENQVGKIIMELAGFPEA